MYNYCTLFDSNYLTRGLAMYQSLKRHSSDFHLYIFAFDERSYRLLNILDVKQTTIISLTEFENEDLLKIKKGRSATEYCWTCTPSIIKYAIEQYKLDNCTYLDADLYFFSDPSVLIKEMGSKSVLITKHRYTKKYDQSATCGMYCVQFVTFKNDKNSLSILKWWQVACNDWCYNRFEDGKFGDQKYLDDWTTRFDGVHELNHLGGGVAPWNIQQYNFYSENKKIRGIDKKNKTSFEVVFYHFHGFILLENDMVELGVYEFNNNDLSVFYKPYIAHLNSIMDSIIKIDNSYDYNGTKPLEKNIRKWADNLIRKLKHNYNIYSIEGL